MCRTVVGSSYDMSFDINIKRVVQHHLHRSCSLSVHGVMGQLVKKCLRNFIAPTAMSKHLILTM